jgi:DNA helicase HerA-like ATPase
MRFEDMDKIQSTPIKVDISSTQAAEIVESPYNSEPEPAPIIVADSRPFAEPEPASLSINTLQNNLGNCLSIIDDEVMKGYVTRLDQLPVIPHNNELDDLNAIHFFKISELVYQEDEFSVDKLSMVFHALSNKPCTLVLMLKSNGEVTDFYLGARPNDNRSAGTLFQMLKQSLVGFFPGSQITDYYDEDMHSDMESINVGCISSVTSVADYKQEQEHMTNKDFIQGLEKFVYAMRGKSYTAILIADNLSYDELMLKKREYEQIYTQISPFANMQMSFTTSDSKSESTGTSDGKTSNVAHTKTTGTSENETDTNSKTTGTSETIGQTVTNTQGESSSESDGNTRTTGTSEGTNSSTTNGVSVGVHGGAGLPVGPNAGASVGYSHSVSNVTSHTKSVSDAISKTLTHGFNESKSIGDSNTYGTNESSTSSKSIGIGRNESDSVTTGEAFNLVNTQSMTDTFGSSKAVTLNAKNMTLNLAMERLQKHLARIDECESFGMWNFAGYFLGETKAETETAANTYKAVIAGTNSGIERNAINSWDDENDIKEIKEYLYHFKHPQFAYSGFSYDGVRTIPVNPSALVSTNELAIHMSLPRHSVIGLPVVEHADFGKEVVKYDNHGEENREIELGNVFDMGCITGTKVKLDCDSLTMHTFITGSTGSGKSTTIYSMLDKLRNNGIKFMVVEPAKGEYKDRFGDYADVSVYGTNNKKMPLLKINPFSFPDDVHVLEHIDRLVDIFNVCWSMYAAMPAVLKDSIERAYEVSGWNLEDSECRYSDEDGNPLFPTFEDVLNQVNVVMNESAYSSDSKGDYKGAICTRLKSLTNGLYRQIFTPDELSYEKLFDSNVIVDLSRTGSGETKSLIMGLLILKLQEYRMSCAKGINANLKHVTVLEEAHNILKRTSTEQSTETANLIGKSVEMIGNSIAEMRTYGEGFIIADQAPGLMDIRNTNTKIILRLPDYEDRELVGRAANLNDEQIEEVSRLETFVAAVYQNNWLEPVLCNVDRNFKSVSPYKYDGKETKKFDKRGIVDYLLIPFDSRNEFVDVKNKLVRDIFKLPIATEMKVEFIRYTESNDKEEIQRIRSKIIYQIYNSENVFRIAKGREGNIDLWLKCIRDNLEPSIDYMEEVEQNKVVANLVLERNRIDGSKETSRLFERFMKFI